jgi:hypothetical protein
MAALSLVMDYKDAGVTAGLQKVGTDGEQAMTRITKSGQQANVVFTQMEKQHQRLGEAAKKSGEVQRAQIERAEAATNFFGRTLGIELPKKFESVIAKSKGLQSIFAAAFEVSIVGLFAKEVIDLIPEIDKATKAMGGFSEEEQALYEQRRKQNIDQIGAPANLGIARQNLDLVNRQIQRKTEVIELYEKEDGLSKVIFGYGRDIDKLESERNQLIAAREQLLQNEAKLEQESLARQMQLAGAAGAAGLHGFAAIEQERRAAAHLLSQAYGSGKISTTELDNSIALIRLKAERDVKELSDQVAAETKQMAYNVAQIGIPAVSAAYVKQASELAKISEDEERTEITHAEAQKRRFLIRFQLLQQLAALQLAADQKTADARQQMEAYGAKGELAIRYELQQRLNELEREQQQSGIDTSQRRVIAEQLADKKIQELRKQAAQQIFEADQRAALAIVPEWQRANAQIVFDHASQVHQINQQLGDKIINEREADRLILDADTEMSGRMIDNHRQMVMDFADSLDQFAQDLSGGNIGKRILENFRKLTMMLVAQWASSFSAIGKGTPNLLMGLLFGGNYLNTAGAGMMAGPAGAGAGAASAMMGGGQPGMGGLGALAMLGGGGGFSAGSSMGMGGMGSLGFGGSGAAADGLPMPGSSGIGADMLGSLMPGTMGGGSGSPVGSFLDKTGLRSMFSGKGLAGLGKSIAPLAAIMLGNKLGGLPTAAGMALMSGLYFNGFAWSANLASALGISSSVAAGLLSGVGGGAIGFGIGQNYGKVAGSLSGAGSGALFGAILGGPVGAAIGAIIGLLGGLFGGIFGGSKRKKQANAVADQVEKDIHKLEDEYKGFQIDYPTALSQLDDMKSNAFEALSKLKDEGRHVFDRRLKPDFEKARAEIQGVETERDRRQGLVFAPPMFHSGGFVDGAAGMMVGFKAGPDETLALLRRGEFVVEPQATAKHRPMLERINSGAPTGGDVYVINALDSKSFRTFLRDGGHEDIKAVAQSKRAEGR